MILNIKHFREQKNYSVEFVSIQLEISKKKYCKIENGSRDIKLSELNKLSRILGVKKSDLIK